MKNFDVKIFESPVNDEAFSRVKEELNKNPNFQITDDNITEFVDCKLVLDVLKEHKIEYKIIANDRWTTRGRIPQYDLIICIYIISIKYFTFSCSIFYYLRFKILYNYFSFYNFFSNILLIQINGFYLLN